MFDLKFHCIQYVYNRKSLAYDHTAKNDLYFQGFFYLSYLDWNWTGAHQAYFLLFFHLINYIIKFRVGFFID